MRNTSSIAAAALSVAVAIVGFWKGAFVAGGADSYGYVSQARLWASGTLRVDEPLMRQLPDLPADAFAPLGYRPAAERGAIVPTYAPGLPMVMGAFARLFGPRGPFFVVPLLGGVAVWATYGLGSAFSGPLVGLSAACLLATSPAFLYQLMVPMSDVPVTAWWTLTLALLLPGRRDRTLIAGFAAAAAILTRPNLAMLACVPATLIPPRRRVLFGIGVAAACISIGALNTYWYGSPVQSGYGSLDYVYRFEHFWTNAVRYPRWLVDTETPVVVLAVLAPLFVRAERRPVAIMWLVFIAGVFLCYAFFSPFDEWWYLRFLLPAFPPLLVLTMTACEAVAHRLGRHGGVAVVVLLTMFVAWRGFDYATRRGFAFELKTTERKYAAVGEYLAAHLPERAVLLTVQHSGSARYYSGRATLRYDWIPSDGLDRTLDQLRAMGYHPYFLLEEWEEGEFRARFRGRSQLADLDWPPVASLRRPAIVKIFDPADRFNLERRTDFIY